MASNIPDVSSNSNPAQIIEWNQQAQHAPTGTYIRSLYDGWTYCERVRTIYEWEGTRVGLAVTLFQILAVPLAQRIGSPRLEEAAMISTEAISAYKNFPGWLIGRTLYWFSEKATPIVQKEINRPEVKEYLQKTLADYGISVDRDTLERELKDGVKITLSVAATNLVTPVEKTLKSVHRVAVEQLSAGHPANIEEQKLRQLEQEYEDLEAKNREVAKLSDNPEELVNDAKNLSGGHKDKLSLEASKTLNAHSITGADPYRNTDSFKTAQDGHHGKHRDQRLEDRMGELLSQVKQENRDALERKANEVQLQRQKIEDAKIEASLPPIATTPPPSESPTIPDLSSDDKIKQWAKNVYIRSEDKAKASNPSDLKFAIAKEVAQTVSSDLGIRMDEDWILRFHKAMVGDGRRWYNDVSGEIYTLLTGETTDDFCYKEKGLKKIWSATNDPVKKFLNFLSKHQEGNTLPINGNISSDGGGSLNFYDLPIFNRQAPPSTRTPNTSPNAPTPSTISFPSSSSSTEGNSPAAAEQPENAASSSSSSSSSSAGKSPAAEQPENAASSSRSSMDVPLSNIKDGLTIVGHAAQHGLGGQSSLGLLGSTITIGQSVTEDRSVKGIWNGIVQAVFDYFVTKHPVSAAVVTSSSLYANNVSEESFDHYVDRSFARAEQLNKASEKTTNIFEAARCAENAMDLLTSASNSKLIDTGARRVNDALRTTAEQFKIKDSD